MKLYEVPRETKVRVLAPDGGGPHAVPPSAHPIDTGEILFFDHVDGMYSYCTNSRGQVVHLAAWTEVEIIEEEEQ